MDRLEKLLELQRAFVKERGWEKFHSPKNLSMALAVEAGELLDLFTWLSDKQPITTDPVLLQNAKDEIADVFLYLLRLCDILQVDLLQAVEDKMVKNGQKHTLERARQFSKSLED